MTDGQVRDGFSEIYNNFWNQYKNQQPMENNPEWERMHSWAAALRRKYPFMEETINRMLTELIERARGRGRKADDFQMPPRKERSR